MSRLKMSVLALIVPSLSPVVTARAQSIEVFDPPNSTDTFPRSVNSRGQVAGSFLDSTTGTYRGFVRELDGQFVVFDVPGGTGINVRDINEAGAVTGWYDPANPIDPQAAFLRASDGTFITFAGTANALNDAGDIVGDGEFPDVDGFLRSASGAITPMAASFSGRLSFWTASSPATSARGAAWCRSGRAGYSTWRTVPVP